MPILRDVKVQTRLVWAVAALLVLMLLGQQQIAAHGFLIRTLPASGAVLDSAPARLQAWFTENLEPRFSAFTLTNARGDVIPLEQNGVSATNPAQLSARLPAALPSGSYIATLRVAFTSDGHLQTQSFVFWIGTKSEAVTGTGPSREALPAEVLWRFLSTTGLTLLFGTTFLYQTVLLPGWGSRHHRAGGLPPRVMTRLNVLVGIAISLTALGTLLALFQQTTLLFATDFGTALRGGLWLVVLRDTQYGTWLIVRIALLAMAALLHGTALYLTPRHPQWIVMLWAILAAVAGSLLGTMSAASHAAGVTLWQVGSVAVDWLHLLAISAWVGGLAALALVLAPALAPLAGEERRAAMLAVLRRFSVLASGALLLLIASGLYSTVLHVRQPADLPGAGYGLALVLKLLLVAVLLLIAFYNNLATKPQWILAQFAERFHITAHVERLLTSVRFEMILAVGVLGVASLLSATPPPIPPEALQKLDPPVQETTVEGFRVRFSLDPGAVGANSYEVTVSGPAPAQAVTLMTVYPSLDKRSPYLNLDEAGSGTFVGAGGELERSGEWWVLVDFYAHVESPQRAAFRISVPDTPPLVTLRQPELLNWLSVFAVALAGIAAFGPLTAHALRVIHPKPVEIAVALTAVAATTFMIVLGALLLADASRRGDALANPAPAAINPTLPDAASLQAGQAIYTRDCISCHGRAGVPTEVGPNAPPNFQTRLPSRRDEDLHRLLVEHKSPPLTLTETERWNLINYLRSSAFVAQK